MRKHEPTTGLPKLNENEYAFMEGHPGRRYCCLTKHKQDVVPKISMPKNMICDIEHLEQHSDDPTDAAIIMREEYAKAALILFYPFRSNDLFNTDFDDDLWSKFLRVKSDSRFCSLGLKILQNMQDNIQSRKCKSPDDELTTTTSVPTEDKQSNDHVYDDEEGELGYENANSFGEYDCEELVEHGIVEDDNDDEPRKRNLDDLKINCGRKGYVNPNSIIASRMYPGKSLFTDSSSNGLSSEQSNSNSPDRNQNDGNTQHVASSLSGYRYLLSIISGSALNDMSDGIHDNT